MLRTLPSGNGSTMSEQLRIDMVSDVSCPWCAIGLRNLELALERVQDDIGAQVRFQPFELNPQMPPEGQDIGEHLAQKYGSTPQDQAAIRDTLRERGAEVGFEFDPNGRGRIWNTFDAHRLLHLADTEYGAAVQAQLKHALLAACHTHTRAMSDPAVLLDCAVDAGLDKTRAQAVLDSDEFTAEVRERQRHYTHRGVRAVPAVVIDDRHLISGAQPVEAFEQALRQIAADKR